MVGLEYSTEEIDMAVPCSETLYMSFAELQGDVYLKPVSPRCFSSNSDECVDKFLRSGPWANRSVEMQETIRQGSDSDLGRHFQTDRQLVSGPCCKSIIDEAQVRALGAKFMPYKPKRSRSCCQY